MLAGCRLLKVVTGQRHRQSTHPKGATGPYFHAQRHYSEQGNSYSSVAVLRRALGREDQVGVLGGAWSV
jgi:hypothetical protein